MSKPTISKLKKKLMLLVKEYVKKRDNKTCQWCLKEVEGSNCHVSHVVPVSQGNALAFDPLNMKVLCYHCHLNKWHKRPLEATEWFISKFPDRYEYLEKHKNDIVHWKEFMYEEAIKIWLDKNESV